NIWAIAGVMGKPVTDTTDLGGRPARTRSSTIATASLPSSGVNSYFRKSGDRRAPQVVLVILETSPNSCTADIPPPTTITCWPANSAAFLYSPVCNCLPLNFSQPGYRGQLGVFHVPVALIIPRALNCTPFVRITNLPRLSFTSSTRIGRIIGNSKACSYF